MEPHRMEFGDVRTLLNELTIETFDLVSDQIIFWVNRTKNEKEGQTLIQFFKVTFEKAMDEMASSDMHARLGRKMMEQTRLNLQYEGIRNPEEQPLAGEQLFRKYLLRQCQHEDFGLDWALKDAIAAVTANTDGSLTVF